jgi:hypothetical protein
VTEIDPERIKGNPANIIKKVVANIIIVQTLLGHPIQKAATKMTTKTPISGKIGTKIARGHAHQSTSTKAAVPLQ